MTCSSSPVISRSAPGGGSLFQRIHAAAPGNHGDPFQNASVVGDQARFGFQLRAELFFKFGGFDELFRVAEKADVVTVVIAEWFKPGQFGQLCQPRIVAELRMGIERQVYPVQADIVSEHDPEPVRRECR